VKLEFARAVQLSPDFDNDLLLLKTAKTLKYESPDFELSFL
jgi:hypothetical protein